MLNYFRVANWGLIAKIGGLKWRKSKLQGQVNAGRAKSTRLMSFHTTFLAQTRGERRRSRWGPLKVVLHDIPTPKPTELDADQAGTRAKSFYTTFSKGAIPCCTTFTAGIYIYAFLSEAKGSFFSYFNFRSSSFSSASLDTPHGRELNFTLIYFNCTTLSSISFVFF